MSDAFYVDVILPLALPQPFLTYSVPHEYVKELVAGVRVTVQVGSKKLYSAIAISVHNKKPEFEPKDILNVIDNEPVVGSHQIKFWQWIADYYMCTNGEVMKAALPAGLKIESETIVSIDATVVYDYNELSANEKMIVNTVAHKQCTVAQLSQSMGVKNIMRPLKSLIEKGILITQESAQSKYTPKKSTYISLNLNINSNEQLCKSLELLAKAPKQQQLLMSFIELCPIGGSKTSIAKSKLLKHAGVSSAVYKTCEEKGILTSEEIEEDRIKRDAVVVKGLPELSDAQTNAFNEIKKIFTDNKPILLHGITSSGKTEIYIKLIDEQLKVGKQVLYLLPEIAITTQIVERLKLVFGNKTEVYHSKLNDAERVEIYLNMLKRSKTSDTACVVLGVRSSLFLPFNNLGLIIIDEEHENTYKQNDPAPRYNARDSAVFLASLYGAKVVTGSATPSIESYYNALTGKYGLVELNERYGESVLPNIDTVDMVRMHKKKQVVSSFSKTLINTAEDALASGEQVIFFQNRRGFSPFVQCRECAYVPMCVNCDVSLTYHKYNNVLSCHYCGYTLQMPQLCPQCNSADIKTCGFGTEKIEDELSAVLPNAKVSRLDLDSARAKNSYSKILHDFENHETDILVGTQMIAKGLDFGNVSLAAVLNADNLLNFPDFRAYERSFQLMSQVAGRAGRKSKQGKVIIQTYSPKNPVIQRVIRHDYKGFFEDQIHERRDFFYPPFSRLIRITIKHTKKDVVNEAAAAMKHSLTAIFKKNISGPGVPQVGRVQNKYLLDFLIKLKRDSNLAGYKQLIRDCLDGLKQNKKFASLQVVIDVDPM